MRANLKYTRTEKEIRNAVIALIDNEGLSKITVRQISSSANINRTTFYRHYLDKPDLIDKYRENFLGQIAAIINKEPSNVVNYGEQDNLNALYPLFKKVIDFINNDWEFCQAWLGSQGDPETVTKFVDLINKKMGERLKQVQKYYDIHPVIPLEFAQEFIVSQLWSILKIWFQQSPTLSEKEITDIFMKTRHLSPFELTGITNNTNKTKSVSDLDN
ncbi:TetR/AcrR family transcriptional regulator [Companilactobacillus kimchiensis]|uniref:HTH tetR-type domain-containing protein n=1 Tax=Companilactobacillus kimchiensis TaxID=993692 RepID=A0A0R2LLH1_9LACO|nr:TetR/AcrR family transcriptional regulator [Companilactobacillus kimchiensis]KRO00731.1 hypothetical protein IV57_GL000049 [Companilactobacillus kimchiensis]